MLRSYTHGMDRPEMRLGKQRSVKGCCSFHDDGIGKEEEYSIGGWSRQSNEDGAGSWWKKGWNSVRKAGEWSETLIVEAGSRGGPKWRLFVRRLKSEGRSIYPRKPVRYQYDAFSYAQNFDDGTLQESDDCFSDQFAAPLPKRREI